MKYNEYPLKPDPRTITLKADSEDIYLQIFVGNGQSGGSLLVINNTEIPAGDLTNKFLVVDRASAEHTTLQVITNVLDINWQTDNCVITTKFTDQTGHTLYEKVDKGKAEPGGVASFTGNYIFRLLLLLVLIGNFALPTSAQNSDITFEDLEMPSAPGFILYDETPEAIERPTTPQGLAVTGLNAFQTGGAFEFSPYWLVDHANFSASRVTQSKMPVLSQLSLSIAYINQDTVGHVGFGAKTRLFQVYGNAQKDSLNAILSEIPLILSARPEDIDTNRLFELKDRYSKLAKNPVLVFDLAAAYGGSSLTNSFSDLQSDKWGVWLSASFRPKGDDFYVSGLLRLGQSIATEVDTEEIVLDYGARLNYDLNNLTISGEFLNRSYSNNTASNYQRYSLIGAYKITEGLFFTGSIGKNFEETNNLFVLGGVNFGFSRREKAL